MPEQAGSGERQARPETATPTLAELSFPAMEIYANPAATQTLLDDARVDIAAWLAEEVSTAFAEAEGAAFISGDGVNQPRGLLSYDTVANASPVLGQYRLYRLRRGRGLDRQQPQWRRCADRFDLLDQSRGYRQNARFLMNKSLQATVRKLKSKTEELYLWQPPVQGRSTGDAAGLSDHRRRQYAGCGGGGRSRWPLATSAVAI